MSPRRTGGAILSKRYELSDQLGAGGMAEVFLGRDRVLGRTIAVKTLLAQYAGDPHFIERFRREAQNAAALNHPNIVSIYDTGDDDGTHYIVMEYIQGRTVREAIREEGPLLPERAAEIAADVCAGLSFAHAHGIVHRDIKPANIMLTPTGAVKVADFGIARAVSGDTVTQTAMVLGTAQYFSPEQAQSAPVDARSDLYSLGIVLYEMLTRQVPFSGSSPVAIAYKHVKEAPLPPSRINPDVPPSLEAIVLKALAKNPDNRYQSADEMREDLLRALHGQPVEATPVLNDATGMFDFSSDETIIVEGRPQFPGAGARTADEQRRRTGIKILSAIILAIVGVATWAILGLVGGAKLGKIPDVLGIDISRAEDRLRDAGYEVDIQPGVFSDKYGTGTVAALTPAPGAEVRKGTTVELTPSLGVQFVEVPDVTGKSEAEARRLLETDGFKIGDVTREPSDTVRYGAVIDQDPAPKNRVAKGSDVDLTISSGRAPADVPGVIGRFEDDAVSRLQGAGFRVQVIHEDQSPDCAQDVGRVCRQKPEEGERIARGSTVTIYVARQPAEESPSPEPTILPTGTDTPTPSPS